MHCSSFELLLFSEIALTNANQKKCLLETHLLIAGGIFLRFNFDLSSANWLRRQTKAFSMIFHDFIDANSRAEMRRKELSQIKVSSTLINNLHRGRQLKVNYSSLKHLPALRIHKSPSKPSQIASFVFAINGSRLDCGEMWSAKCVTALLKQLIFRWENLMLIVVVVVNTFSLTFVCFF